MNYSDGIEMMQNGIEGFHGKFKKMYGQIALRLDDEVYLATGMTKVIADIRTEDIAEYDINTGYLGEILRACHKINAVIFGCTQDAVDVSEKYDAVPVALDDIAQISGAFVPVIDEATPDKVIRALSESSVCYVKGSGIIAAGSNMRKAVAAILIAQKSAEAIVHGELIGGVKPFNEEDALKLKNEFESKYVDINENEAVDYIGYDEATFGIRRNILEYGMDLVRKDLVYGAWGNVSARMDDGRMLITPSSMDYFEMRIEDIVEVGIESLDAEGQRTPSGDMKMHAEMYRNLPGCNAIVHTHSNALSVFAACEAGFAINDPNLSKLIGDIKVVPFGDTSSQVFTENLISTMSDTHAAILAHHGAVFYGPSLEIVFSIAEAVELMARNLLGYDRKEETDEDETIG